MIRAYFQTSSRSREERNSNGRRCRDLAVQDLLSHLPNAGTTRRELNCFSQKHVDMPYGGKLLCPNVPMQPRVTFLSPQMTTSRRSRNPHVIIV